MATHLYLLFLLSSAVSRAAGMSQNLFHNLVWSVLRTWLLCIVLLMVLAVVCNFNSVKQAMVMTLVKTVAFAGAIVLYTIISLVMFPLTATQQVGLGMCMHLLAAPMATAVSRPDQSVSLRQAACCF